MFRPLRTLLGWLNEQEAVMLLLGRAPAPGQDVAPQIADWNAKRAAVAARPIYNLAPPVAEPLPAQLQARAAAFVQRPDVQAALVGLTWQVALVNLEHALAFQKAVVIEAAEERTHGAIPDDWDALFSVSLPDAAAAQELAIIVEAGKSFTVSSLNPNLRVIGHAIHDAQMPAGPGQAPITSKVFGFPVKLSQSFIQVAVYNGRWLVRDGYHRCYGLLRRGITRIPCVVVEAHNFAEVGAQNQEFITFETLFGDRPPFMRDFLDDAVSANGQQTAVRKVIRITAEEFSVEI